MLVISTLGYGSAWAYDGHATVKDSGGLDRVTAFLYQGAQYQKSVDTHTDHESEHASIADALCDHCGHVSAHLQAIFTQNVFSSCVNQSSELLEFSEDLSSIIVSPDFRPPRV